MLFNNVSIIGIGHQEANNVVTSESIEAQLSKNLEKFGMRKHFIQELTGIKERRFWDAGVLPSHGSVKAAVKALEDAKLDKSKVGILINTSVTRDYVEPATATNIHRALGLKSECINFDISNACLGFLNGMQVAASMIELGNVDYALIVNSESGREIVEKTLERVSTDDCDEDAFKNAFASLTLASGAVAMVLARKDLVQKGHQFVGSVFLANTEANHLCQWSESVMKTDAKGLLKEGLILASTAFQKAKEELEWDKKQIDQYIIHQVGIVHTMKLSELIGVDLTKYYTTFTNYGNIGPVSLPFTLSKMYEDNAVKEGERIALMGIGSGLNCAMMEVIW